MKKIKKTALLFLVLFALCTVLPACGPNSGMDGDAYAVTIYTGRATGKTAGTYDEQVKEALEEKFYEDRGIRISLNMNVYEGDDLTQKIHTAIGNQRVSMDAFTNTVSTQAGSSLTYSYGRDPNGSTKEVGSLLEEYGQNILAAIRKNDEGHIAERTPYISINGDFEMKFLPTVYHSKTYGLMLRKDYWRNAFRAGATALDPDDYDVANPDCKNLSVDEFVALMKAVRQTEETVTTPITGLSWDIERTIGACFGAEYLNMYKDENGYLYAKEFSPAYGKMLDYLYTWSSEGLWEKDSLQLDDDSRLNNFLAGKHMAYIVYPEVENLIRSARRLKAVDADSECMLIAPLKVQDEQGNWSVNGFFEQNPCFQGLALPFDGKNAEILVQFLDWMYADTENYELAKYGIKGEHWIDGPDYTWTFGGKTYTYKTWQYPPSKQAEFSNKSPYSGCWEEILRNVNMSDRINNAWTPTEKNWYIYATNICEGYASEDLYGYLLPEMPRSVDQYAYNETVMEVTYVYGHTLAGKLYRDTMPSVLTDRYREQVRESSKDYLEWYKQWYQTYGEFYAETFGG